MKIKLNAMPLMMLAGSVLLIELDILRISCGWIIIAVSGSGACDFLLRLHLRRQVFRKAQQPF